MKRFVLFGLMLLATAACRGHNDSAVKDAGEAVTSPDGRITLRQGPTGKTLTLIPVNPNDGPCSEARNLWGKPESCPCPSDAHYLAPYGMCAANEMPYRGIAGPRDCTRPMPAGAGPVEVATGISYFTTQIFAGQRLTAEQACFYPKTLCEQDDVEADYWMRQFSTRDCPTRAQHDAGQRPVNNEAVCDPARSGSSADWGTMTNCTCPAGKTYFLPTGTCIPTQGCQPKDDLWGVRGGGMTICWRGANSCQVDAMRAKGFRDVRREDCSVIRPDQR